MFFGLVAVSCQPNTLGRIHGCDACYSYRSASTGYSRNAFSAGKNPNTILTKRQDRERRERSARLTNYLVLRHKRCMNVALLISVGLFVMAMPQDAARARFRASAEVAALIAKLPDCSRLRQQLQEGKFGDGTEKPYMRPMLDHGVQRVYFEVAGEWRLGRAAGIRIVRRLYYKQLDGIDAQKTDTATVKEIRDSGLEAMLDEAVLARATTAHLYAGVDRWAGFGQIGFWGWRLRGGKFMDLPSYLRMPGCVHLLQTWCNQASTGKMLLMPPWWGM